MHRNVDDQLREELRLAIDEKRRDRVETLLEHTLWGLLFEDLRLASRALGALAPHDGVWAVRAAAVRIVLWSHQGSDLLGSPDLVAGAPRSMPEAVAAAPMSAEWLLVELGESRRRADAEGTRRLLSEIATRDAAGTLEPPGSPLLLRALLRVQVAIAHLHYGASGTALAQLSTAARLADGCGALRRSILAKSAAVHALRGNLFEARRQLRRSDLIVGEIPGPWVRSLREERTLAEAFIVVERYEGHDPDTEWPEVEASDDLWPITALLRARQALLERSPIRALEIVELAEVTHPGPPSPLALDVVVSMKAHALMQLAETDRAAAVLGEVTDAGPLVILARAHLWVRTGDPQRARELATHVLGRQTSSLVERAEGLLLRMWADALQGQAPSVSDSGIVTRMVVAGGLVRIIAHLPGWLLDDIVDKAEHSIRGAFEAEIDKAAAVLAYAERPELTPREKVVLRALATSSSVSDIARSLSVSPSTIKTQLSAIYRKLGVSSRRHAIPAAHRLGLIERAEP